MIIETERLIIRPPKKDDAKPLNEAINHSLPELQKWMPWAYDPSLETTEKFINDGVAQWQQQKPTQLPMIIELKSENNKIISASGFNEQSDFSIPYVETGYWIDSSYTGKGYITEAVIAQTRYAFEILKVVRVQIRAQKENSKSRAVAERCGFHQEAILHNVKLDCITNAVCDDVIYACFDVSKLPELKVDIPKSLIKPS